MFFPVEAAGGIPTRHWIESDHSSARVALAAGFVEPDMPRAANAEHLNIDAPCLGNQRLVLLAEGLDLFSLQVAAWDVNVAVRDVHVIEKVLTHPAVVAVDRLRIHRPVFIEVERHDAREVESFFAVQADELAIDADRRRSGRQPQHGRLALIVSLPDEVGHFVSDVEAHFVRGREDRRREFRAPGNREVVFRRVAKSRRGWRKRGESSDVDSWKLFGHGHHQFSRKSGENQHSARVGGTRMTRLSCPAGTVGRGTACFPPCHIAESQSLSRDSGGTTCDHQAVVCD